MNVLIIEDEYLNAQRLQRLLVAIDGTIIIKSIQHSVQGAVTYLRNNPDIDLLFLDIQLSDGTGFEVLEQLEQHIPVIITSAFEQYALQAYQYLSIDYLLKPIKEEALRRSVSKFKENFNRRLYPPTPTTPTYFQTQNTNTTLIGRRGKNRYPIKSNSIAFCFREDRETWISTLDGKEYMVSSNLDELENTLATSTFFRANRKTICAKNAVEKFEILPKSRIKLMLAPAATFDIVISSDKSAAFKQWICE